MTHETHFAANRANWDERALIHAADATGFYRLAELRAGADTLDPIAGQGIGDVAGLRIAHLQCHIGTDSLCLARRGAHVTGLDFSPTALRVARALAAETGLAAEFVQANVYDARSALPGHFDRVFVTWGAINWLPDIAAWARVVASLLKPGGELFLAEGHPAILCFDWVDGDIRPRFDRLTAPDAPITEDQETTYNGAETRISNTRTYEWIHPLSAIFNALIEAGLQITRFDEHEGLPWRLFANMEQGPDHLWRLPPGHPRLPLGFSLRARAGAVK